MTLNVLGIPATLKVLDGLPKKQAKRVLPKAARAGGGVFRKAAKANCPVGNRTLKRSLIVVIRRYRTGALAVIGQDRGKLGGRGLAKKIKVGGGISGRGDLVPIHLVESPVKPHVIRAKNAKALAFSSHSVAGDTTVVRRIVRHKGHRGRHFIRKAAKEAQGSAVRAFTNKLQAETLKEVLK